MESLIGFMGAALALLAVFVLYLGGTAIVLRFVQRLLPTKNGPGQDSTAPQSAS